MNLACTFVSHTTLVLHGFKTALTAETVYTQVWLRNQCGEVTQLTEAKVYGSREPHYRSHSQLLVNVHGYALMFTLLYSFTFISLY